MRDYNSVNIANAEAARAAGWPDLTGTPKQIPWAITCRANKMRELEATDLAQEEKNRWREVMLRETRAGEWIDYDKQPWTVVGFMSLTEEEKQALLDS